VPDTDAAITPLTEADLPAVVDLCRSALDLPEDAAEADAIVARLREAPEPDGRPLVGFVAGQPGDGGAPSGVVLASVGHRDSLVGHVDLVAVAPAARRKGVGRALVAAAERALAGLGAREVLLAGNAPRYAWPGIDVRYTPAVCAATALGYERDEVAWNMTVDLSPGSRAVRPTDPAESRLAASGVRVRRAGPADREALSAFAAGAFEGSWGEEVADSIGRPGAGCHFADRDGEVLGFAAYGSSRPSWFGPMGTAPAAQGLGIGGVLLRRCLIDMRDAGHGSAQIGWVGPVPFYSAAVDARIERVFVSYRKRLG
jgi:predicted N-acetyltransferase YhbS